MLNPEEQKVEFQQVIKFLNKNKATLFLVCFISVILSVTITFFIPKEYSSSAIIFPPAAVLLETSIENPNFGYDVEADRLLQIASSSEVRDSVIKKFDLLSYYKIDTTTKDWLSKLSKNYHQDISFSKTQFMSVVISAQTKDPEMCTNIVNYLIEVVDAFREKVYKQNIKLALIKTKEEFFFEKRITDSLFNRLQNDIKVLNISGLVLLAPSAQLSLSYEQLSSAKGGAMENLTLGSDILNYRFHLEKTNELETKLWKLNDIIDNPIAQVHVINRAETSYKKVSPSYTVNAAIMLVVSFMITTLILIYKSSKT